MLCIDSCTKIRELFFFFPCNAFYNIPLYSYSTTSAVSLENAVLFHLLMFYDFLSYIKAKQNKNPNSWPKKKPKRKPKRTTTKKKPTQNSILKESCYHAKWSEY